MARYFFHLFNDEITHDEEGIELADDEAARGYAAREARNQASVSVLQHGHLVLSHRIEVVDAAGRAVATVRFGDVVEIVGDQSGRAD
jgi:hypothetical protein